MKFIYQIEIEDDVCDNENYPKDTHARMFLDDLLSDAIYYHMESKMNTDLKFIIEAKNRTIKMIKDAKLSIKLIESK